MKHSFFSFLFLLLAVTLYGQDLQENWDELKKDPNLGTHMFLQYKLHVGQHAYSGKTFTEYLTQTTYGHELRLGWRTTGNDTWTRALNYPLYGIGIYRGFIGDEKKLGSPWAAYSFFQFPFWWRPKHHFALDFAAGVTFNLKPYHPETNPDNDAIGASTAMYFSASFGGDFVLTDAFDLSYGVGLTHFSNGRMAAPNYGLNMFEANMGLRYNFNTIKRKTKKIDPAYKPSRKPVFVTSPLGKKPKSQHINLFFAPSTVVYQFNYSNEHYSAWTAFIEYHRRYGHIGGLTVGFDWMYDGSQEAFYNVDGIYNVSTLKKMYGGIHIGHSLYIHKFNLETQFGMYVYKPAKYKGNWYMRIALKYHFTKWMYASVGLKTLDGGAADWAEFGVGFTLFNREDKK